MVGMTRALPRPGFNSSRLRRFLADLGVAAVADARQSFAERLGQWLDFTDAIALSAALNGRPAGAPDAKAGAAVAAALGEDADAVRRALAGAIMASGVPAAAGAEEADFSPFHRYYLARQRDMESSINPLRARVRAALAGLSPALRQLAAVDAALDQAMGARERSLLSTVPLLLEKRFEALAGAAGDPAGGWLAAFCRDMQGVLLAELDLRLEPVLGLIEALGNEVTEQQ